MIHKIVSQGKRDKRDKVRLQRITKKDKFKRTKFSRDTEIPTIIDPSATINTEIPTIIDPSATINYPSATGSIIVGISVVNKLCFHRCYTKFGNTQKFHCRMWRLEARKDTCNVTRTLYVFGLTFREI
jgi:hypothetical protein